MREQANRYYQLGLAQFREGQYQEALPNFQEALPIFREIGDRDDEAHALFYIGRSHYNLGDHGKALDSFDQALELGEHSKTLDCLYCKLAIFRELGDPKGEAESLLDIGVSHYNLREQGKALESFQQGLPILKALDSFQQALAIFRELGDPKGEARSLFGIGLSYKELKEHHEAIKSLQQVLAICPKLSDGDRLLKAQSLFYIGLSHKEFGEHDKALECFQEILPICR